MSDPFVAEIRMFSGNFAPKGWAFCDGQMLPISQNTALFSLLGTTYGGDGRTIFGLPNLQGRAPMQPGHGPGLSSYSLGESGGTETVTLTEAQTPTHTHTLSGVTQPGTQFAPSPANSVLARSVGGNAYAPSASPSVSMSPASLSSSGGSQSHQNMQPYLTITFIIALQGVYPPRG
jgi:microcystin-dependent protein